MDKTQTDTTEATFLDLMEDARMSPAWHKEKILMRFLMEANRILVEKQISKAELARRMNVSPAYISRIFNQGANFTLDTMARLSAALEAEVTLTLTEQVPFTQHAAPEMPSHAPPPSPPKTEGLPRRVA